MDTPVVVGQGEPLDAPVASTSTVEPTTGDVTVGAPALSEVNGTIVDQEQVGKVAEAGNAPAVTSSPKPGKPGDYLPVSFAYLSSFDYDVPDPFSMKNMKEEDHKKLSDQIPEYIRKLDKTKVALSGFMVPIDIIDEGVKTFILTSNQMMCCFGQMPWYNEWVFVEMPDGKPATFHNDIPVTVDGVLEIGEEIEDGFVISLFRMKGDQISLAEGSNSIDSSSNN